MDRPVTTLFMLMSVDGKISTDLNGDYSFTMDNSSCSAKVPCTTEAAGEAE